MADIGDLSKCIRGLTHHQWSQWFPIPCPDDLMPEDGFLYRRECQIMGCNVVQKAAELLPNGKSEFSVLPFSPGYERG